MYIETGVAIAITGVLVKALDILYSYIKNKTSGDKIEKKIDRILNINEDILNIIARVDQDNVPLVYTPRQILVCSKEQIELTKSIVHSNEMTAKSLDKITSIAESMIRVLDKLDDRTLASVKKG